MTIEPSDIPRGLSSIITSSITLHRHIVIGGISHCGSTLLGLVLGGLPGCTNVGESQKLVRSAHGEAYPCQLCGPSCRVWTPAFRRQLDDDATDWHRRLAERLGTSTLVSTEKTPAVIQRLDPALRNTTVVLYKSPAQIWPSFQRRDKAPLDVFLTRYERVYSRLMGRRHAPAGGKIFVRMEAFQRDPEGSLRTIAAAIDLPFSRDALDYWTGEQHYISGSLNIYDPARSVGRNAIRPPSPVAVDPAMLRQIRSSEAYRTFAKMERRGVLGRLDDPRLG